MIDRANHERALQLTVDDVLDQAAGGAGAHHRAHLRVSLGKSSDQLRQAQGEGGLQRTDLQHTPGLAVIAGGAGGIEQQFRQAVGEGQDAPPRGRHLYALGAALEQRNPQLVLQRADPRGHVRLYGVQFAGGLVHAAVAGYRGHYLEIRDIHRTHLSEKTLTNTQFKAH
ncbi:hypothetical protein D3C84_723300 [compost metagenome]